MPFSDPTLALERVDDKRWMLLRSLYYQGETDLIIVPAGFKTDLASVPRVLQWFAPSSGQYTLAAVLHDYLCDRMVDGRAYLYDDYCRLPGAARESYITARDADGLFRRVMREEGVPIALR